MYEMQYNQPIMRLYIEKKMNSQCFVKKVVFFKVEISTFSRRMGVKLEGNSMERGVKSFPAD